STGGEASRGESVSRVESVVLEKAGMSVLAPGASLVEETPARVADSAGAPESDAEGDAPDSARAAFDPGSLARDAAPRRTSARIRAGSRTAASRRAKAS